MNDERLFRYVIHRSLNRPDTIFGCERKPLYMVGLISATMVFSSFNLVIAICGVLLFCVGVFLLRKMAKADPFMSMIFQRSMKYHLFYPVKSTPFAKGATVKRKRL